MCERRKSESENSILVIVVVLVLILSVCQNQSLGYIYFLERGKRVLTICLYGVPLPEANKVGRVFSEREFVIIEFDHIRERI